MSVPAPHVYDCQVRFSDVDVYGHVNNVKYFEYYQEARISFIRALGHDVMVAGSDDRQVVARVDVDYKRPMLFRPEPYAVESWVTRVGTSSYDVSSRIVDRTTGPEAATYSTAVVRLVAFDLSTQRSRALSPTERERLQALLVTPG